MGGVDLDPIGGKFASTTEHGACACGSDGTRSVFPNLGIERGGAFDFPFRCEGCAERDRIESEQQHARERAERREQEAEERFGSRVASAWLPKALRDVSEPTGHPAALMDARRWIAGEQRGLLFVGPPGTGKTHTAAWCAWQRMVRAREVYVGAVPNNDDFVQGYTSEVVRWVSAPQLFNWLSRPFESQERERADRVLNGRGPLILDDIDKARATEYGAEQVFLLIDNAVNDERLIIVTANRPVSELEAKWPINGRAIASRLAGYCGQHLFNGHDRRLPHRQAA